VISGGWVYLWALAEIDPLPFIRPQVFFLLGMNTRELVKAFLQVPELSTVGSSQERAAFIALHVEGRTIREAAEAFGVSKSQVANLSNHFQAKVSTKIGELQRKHIGGSLEYKAAFIALRDRLYELAEESGSDDYDWDWKPSREDLAECFGLPSPRFDGE
jgi:transposase